MKEWIKDYVKSIGLVIGCAIAAILLLTLAYMIPRDLFVKHIEESENLLYALCDDNNINANIDGYVYDTKTNIITLEEVIAPREHGFPGCLAGTEFQLYPGFLWRLGQYSAK